MRNVYLMVKSMVQGVKEKGLENLEEVLGRCMNGEGKETFSGKYGK